MAQIRVKIDGDIIIEGHAANKGQKGIPVIVLGNTLLGLQNAINRGYISLTRGNIGKGDKMHDEDYGNSQFIIYALEQNCISFNLFGKTRLVKKINEILDKIFEEAKKEFIARGKAALDSDAIGIQQNKKDAIEYETYVSQNKDALEKEFEHRSVLKYIDEATKFVRSGHYKDSTINLSLVEDRTYEYLFNSKISTNFGRIINKKSLTKLTKLECYIKDILDTKSKAVIEMKESKKLRTLLFRNKEDMRALYPHDVEKCRTIFCSPIFEFDTYDFEKGDLYFLGIAE